MLAVTIVAVSGALFLFVYMMILVASNQYPSGYFAFESICS
jgi:hypothetical protein